MSNYGTTLYGRALLQGSAGPVIEYENGLPEDKMCAPRVIAVILASMVILNGSRCECEHEYLSPRVGPTRDW